VLVDWFTVIAQIVNFLILVALLKHFLYGRIIGAMDRREKRIQARLKEAEMKRKEAEEEAETYRRKNEELDEKRRRMLSEAEKDANRKHKELIEKAREEVEQTRLRWQESLEKEKDAFLRDLKHMTAWQVYVLSRKVLKDLSDADLEERLVDVFVSRIRGLEKADKEKLVKALREGESKATVRSGFELRAAARQKITGAVREEIAESADLTYKTDPEMIMGIEIKAQGEKVVWSVRDYLSQLHERAKSAIEEESRKGEEEKGEREAKEKASN